MGECRILTNVSDEARGPIAIRVTRPYATEDEFLEHELDCIGRSGVVLVGAQQRSEGVMLRFELVLKGGALVLRGEGRVVGYKPKALGEAAGLALRFTRLDSRSKAFIDKATSLRLERGRPSSEISTGERPSVVPPPISIPQMSQTPQMPPPVPPRKASSMPPPLPPPLSRKPPPLPAAAENVDIETTYVDSKGPEKAESVAASARSHAPARENGRAMIAAPARRDELLERLRKRALTLDPDRVNALIPQRTKP